MTDRNWTPCRLPSLREASARKPPTRNGSAAGVGEIGEELEKDWRRCRTGNRSEITRSAIRQQPATPLAEVTAAARQPTANA